MDPTDTPETLEQKLAEARDRLRRLEDDVSGAQLIARIRARSPFHPALVARSVTALLAAASLLFAVGVLAAPRLMPEYISTLRNIDEQLGLPLPYWFLLCAAFMGIAWGFAGQAAYASARDYPMLRWEAEDVERLKKLIKRLDEDLRIARSTAFPKPAMPTSPGFRGRWPSADRNTGSHSIPSGSHAIPLLSPSLSRPATTPQPFAEPTGDPSTSDRPLVSFDERSLVSFDDGAVPAGREPETRGGTPLGAPPLRSGRPIGAQSTAPRTDPRFGAPAPLDFGTDETPPSPRPTMREVPTPRDATPKIPTPRPSLSVAPGRMVATPSAPPPVPDAGPLIDFDALPDIVDTATYSVSTTSAPASNPRNALPGATAPQSAGGASADLPNWGRVDEPWLEDAIARAEDLAQSFPIQARLEFSPESDLPFALLLERATPAMAVRCMVSYVEFLASIATPRRGRVVLRNVPHLERSFHKNIEAALDPYFGERAKVSRDGEKVEIKFTDPDSRWVNYPVLPIL
jgi:hypothetical protein